MVKKKGMHIPKDKWVRRIVKLITDALTGLNDLSTEEVTLFPRRQNLAAQGVDTPTEMPEGFNAGGRTRLI